jgi:ATP-dependent Clp protease ATP-binding subunit ClpA
MNGYNFSDDMHRCLQLAREESVRLGHEFVGTEHILLGIVHFEHGNANRMLARLGVDPDALVEKIKSVRRAQKHAVGPDLPYTSRAKRVLELSMRTAMNLNHSYIDTEHMLVGLALEDRGVAAEVLGQCGASPEKLLQILPQFHDGGQAKAQGPSAGYNFTDRVRKVLQVAREEAVRLRSEFVGPDHLMLGLVREGEGAGLAALQNLGVDYEGIGKALNKPAPAKRDHGIGPDLLYTARAKKVLELAMTNARELNHSYVGTEHLVLGVFAEGRSEAAKLLARTGVTLESVRGEILRLLGPESTGPA